MRTGWASTWCRWLPTDLRDLLAGEARLLRAQFLDAARVARDKLGGSVVPNELILKVQGWLADQRNEHR